MRASGRRPFLLMLVCGVLALGGSSGDSGDRVAGEAATALAREARFADTDQNGKIESQELGAAQTSATLLLMIDFTAADRDGDGALSGAEFEAAGAEAKQALATAESEQESSQAAEEALAQALSARVLLDRLATSASYADELAALRAAVKDLDDDEAIVTHIVQNPTLYPRLSPLFRTYVRYYPVKPALRRLAPAHAWPLRHPPKLNAHPDANPPGPTPAVKPPPASKPPKGPAQAHPQPRAGSRGRP